MLLLLCVAVDYRYFQVRWTWRWYCGITWMVYGCTRLYWVIQFVWCSNAVMILLVSMASSKLMRTQKVF